METEAKVAGLEPEAGFKIPPLLSGLQMTCIGEGRTSGGGWAVPLIPRMLSPGCGQTAKPGSRIVPQNH